MCKGLRQAHSLFKIKTVDGGSVGPQARTFAKVNHAHCTMASSPSLSLFSDLRLWRVDEYSTRHVKYWGRRRLYRSFCLVIQNMLILGARGNASLLKFHADSSGTVTPVSTITATGGGFEALAADTTGMFFTQAFDSRAFPILLASAVHPQERLNRIA